jgi:hypothetical protein
MLRTADRSAERQAVRMHQMMVRLDVDLAAFVRVRNGEAYAEARSRCLKCIDIGECLRWLDGQGCEAEGPHFCPNLKIFHPWKRLNRAC